MGFVVVEPGWLNTMEPLPEGVASIAKSGKLTARRADLALAAIGHAAVVLADRDSFRLALRAPRGTEEGKTVAVSTVSTGQAKRDSGRRSINVPRAIRALDLMPEHTAGRYTLNIHGEGASGLLILNLMPETSGKGKGAK